MKKRLPAKGSTIVLSKRLYKLLILHFVIINGFIFQSIESKAQGTWTKVTNLAPYPSGGVMLLLTDGTVMCKTASGGGSYGDLWNLLTPDSHGSYINGTWSTLNPMTYTRLYFSSEVLRDGNVYVAGGEYGTGDGTSELYNTLAHTWTTLPSTGHNYVDANSELLPDGTVLQSCEWDNVTFVYNEGSNGYTNQQSTLGTVDESAWVKLPDGSILFVNMSTTASERYIPSSGTWIADGTVPVQLYDPYGDEAGPGFLLPDGRAFFFGSTGHTAYYSPSGTTSPGTWAAGPDIPNSQGMPDAPGAMLPTGKILIAVSPAPTSGNHFPAPTAFYEFDYTTNTYSSVNAPGGGTSLSGVSSYTNNFLDLPDGTVLYSDQQQSTSVSEQYYVYTPGGSPLAAGKPVISAINGCASPFTVTGANFNGISEGAAYGDDWQMATNYPIVKLTSGTNVYFGRTFNWNRTGVQTGSLADTVQFTPPSGLAVGTYSLTVIANGISSDPSTFNYNGALAGLSVSPSNPSLCPGSSIGLTASGATSYSWSPSAGLSSTTGAAVNANPSSTTTYTVTGTGSGGCTGTTAVTVTVTPASVTVNPSSPVICKGSSVGLTASGASTYSWNPSTGLSSSTGASVTASPSVTTNYTVTGTENGGCSGTRVVSVTVNPLPTVSVTPASASICVGSSASLTASGASTYAWNPTSGLSGATGPTVSASPSVTTTYIATGTDVNGCTNTKSVSVTVNALPSVSVTPTSSTICQGSLASLTASGASVYSWSPSSGLNVTTGATVAASPAVTTTYTVSGTSAAGCTNTKTATVTVNAVPSVSISPSAPSVCQGSSASLTASGASTYSWSPSTGLSATTGATVSANPTVTTTYTATGTNSSSCTSTKTVTVIVNSLPSVLVAPSSPSVCQGYSTSLTASGALTYSWSPATGLSATTGANVSAGPSATTTYTTTGTDANGCTNTKNVTVTVTALPTVGATATPSSTICAGSSVALSGTGATSYNWSGGVTNGIPFVPSSSATYTVTGTSAGCSNTNTISVTVSACSITLNLKLFIQGYYIGNSTMNPALMNEQVTGNSSLVDTVKVSLIDSATLNTVQVAKGVLTINGALTVIFPSTATGNKYYLKINHRNALETWSSFTVTMTSTTSYDFTTAAGKAYGNNQASLSGGLWGLFTGDINQDGYIDANDFPQYDYDNYHAVAFIYVATDLNGDGYVDANDFPVFDGNNHIGTLSIHP